MYPTFLTASLLTGMTVLPAVAHEVQLGEDVGATMHIEPNDVAQAGAPTAVWFALTKAGGEVIPLTACDCRLTLYNSGEQPLATPSLTAISAEGFNNIPGATVTFPDVGAYELRLQGQPKEGVQFTPFELSFEVTVAGRASGAAPAEPTAAQSDSAEARDTTSENASLEAASSETDIAAASETQEPTLTSNFWSPVLLWGGAVLAVGIVWGILGNARSPGGKS
jgi:hypothetical protein